ncbi:Stationary phase inducible protein CsiE [Paramixta manurensis]|uniref:Stationary phase inducible protein CsiE n=1 Tax=Paramixta manurensis TaxID=2740817 RepID=A0A6M8UH95_9GAMM|nr:Stationary phase inducible protein CsiE [Erwiniaceae bacterium PD-1]
MTSSATPTAPLFSGLQRQCHLLLTLYLPDNALSLDALCQLNGVEPALARQDIAEVAEKIQRYHQLDLLPHQDGHFQLRGAELARRLCLMHWLRRALRVSPDFVWQHFAPALRQTLRTRQIEKAIYDEKNLQALIQHCSAHLQRDFNPRDRHFLQLFMQYSLCQQTPATFTEPQQRWLADKSERAAAEKVVSHWQKRCRHAPDTSEIDFYTLIFSLIHAPTAETIQHHREQRLMEDIRLLIQRFQTLAGMHFCDEQGLSQQLYTHMSQALDRSHFAIGIDSNLTEEVTRLYPRLLRTTRAAIDAFETHYAVRFTREELVLIAVIFGAWLMQENTLQEKQVLLLTGGDPALEKEIEQQLRELTLLPLNIKFQTMHAFQHQGAPKGIALVISPYATPLPLYSPPLIHAELPLSDHQQHRIRTLLES